MSMRIKEYLAKKRVINYLISAIFIIFLLNCVSVAAAPSITYNWNTQTFDDSTSVGPVDTNDLIIFEVGSNESIDTWHWFLNGKEQDLFDGVHTGNNPHFYYLAENESSYRMWAGWYNGSIDNVSVYGENANGTTEMLTWVINVNSKTGSITGYITNDTGSAINGANVSIHNNETLTNATGYFEISDVPIGKYSVLAHKSGYNYNWSIVDVKEGVASKVNITLDKWYEATISIWSDTEVHIEDGHANLTILNQSLANSSMMKEVSPGIWQINFSISVHENASLYITPEEGDKEVRLEQGNFIRTWRYPTSYIIDSITIEAWNTTTNQSVQFDEGESSLRVGSNNSRLVVNSIMNNTWISRTDSQIEPNTTVLENSSVYRASVTNNGENRIILRNIIQVSDNELFKDTLEDYRGSYIAYNAIIQNPSLNTNAGIGENSTVIGNEFAGSSWNLVGPRAHSLYKNNILHWNDGKHNAFNPGDFNTYFVGNLFYNVTGYSGHFNTGGPEYQYYFNETFDYRRNWVESGLPYSFQNPGHANHYIYNATAINVGLSNAFAEIYNLFFRKISVIDSWGYGMKLKDTATYGWTQNYTVIDSVFNKTQDGDFRYRPNATNPYRTLTHFINTYNATGEPPTLSWDIIGGSEGGDLREYVWLDVLVQDELGNTVEGANVTVETLEGNENVTVINKYDQDKEDDVVGNITIERHPALAVFLPPPPPDLEEPPASTLPMPSLSNLTSIQTLSDGHTPLPNYGWSNNVEPSIALMFQHRKIVETESHPYQALQTTWNYTYRITAEKDGIYSSMIVTPDTSWYRENPQSTPEVGKGKVVIALPINEAGTVTGTVKDNKTNNPISGATVTAGSYSTTSNKGGYTIKLPAGNYTVKSSAGGYHNKSIEVEVLKNQTITVDFKMNPLPEISSCDINGTITDEFIEDEAIYAKGKNFPPNTDIDIYIVDNPELEWQDGVSISSFNIKNITRAKTGKNGDFFELAWNNPLQGEYDVIADVNRDGYYNATVDAVDNVSAKPGVTATVTSTQIIVNNLEFGDVVENESTYYYLAPDESISIAEGGNATNILPFAVIEGGGLVTVSLGTNRTLPNNATIYLDDDTVPDEDDSTMVVIKGNSSNIAEIIGNNTIEAEKIYAFLKAKVSGDFTVNVVLNA